ncbi:hypothetical protein MSM1_13695 [Mycobacterium sp. SM1]|uniref:hypothetical protein n=1 Tax=Mycobacterium sp. SM1 TaxID=2816243 RepID=UPI001BCE779D|nr:hypothetical protein [Mycobacterium sp. SM1]MBS4729344.1 hypothetical protein [Mycobacterium sp. SM1]
MSGRRGEERHSELAEIEALIAAGKVSATRVARTVIDGRDTYRMQVVCAGRPPRRHRVGKGTVSYTAPAHRAASPAAAIRQAAATGGSARRRRGGPRHGWASRIAAWLPTVPRCMGR